MINKTNNIVLAENTETAHTAVSRLLGLMGRFALPAGSALWLKPCVSVHTFFMRFPIDVLFVSPQMEVVGIRENMKPWRVSKVYTQSAQVLELPAGLLNETGTQLGDILELEGAQ